MTKKTWTRRATGQHARVHRMIPLASTQNKSDKDDGLTLYLRDEFKFDFFVNGLSKADAIELGNLIESFCAERDAVAGGNVHGTLYRNGRRVK